MRIRSVIIIFLAIFSSNINAQLQRNWSTDISTISSSIRPFNAITTDAIGNTYVLGSVYGSQAIDFDPSSSSYSFHDQGQEYNAYLAKYDVNGALVFAKPLNLELYNSSNITIQYYIRTNSNNEVVICFPSAANTYNIATDLDPSENAVVPIPTEGNLVFATYDANGNYISSFSCINGPALSDYSNYRVNDFEIDNNDDFVITGFLNSGIFGKDYEFDTSPSSSIISATGAGSRVGFIAKYSSSGVLSFANGLHCTNDGDLDECIVSEVEIDSQNNIWILGSGYQSMDLDPSAAVYLVTSTDFINRAMVTFIAKYDDTGNFISEKHMDSGHTDPIVYGEFTAFEINDNDDLIVVTVQDYDTDFDFGSGVSSASPSWSFSSGVSNQCVAKYTSAYTLEFVGALRKHDVNSIIDLKSNSNNDFYIYTDFAGLDPDIQFNLNDLSVPFTSLNTRNSFIAKYNAAGIYQNKFLITSGYDDKRALSLAVKPDGTPVVSGNVLYPSYQSQKIDLSPSPGGEVYNKDPYLINYSNTLSGHEWIVPLAAPTRMGSQSSLDISASTTDDSNNFYITGRITGDYDTTTTIGYPFVNSIFESVVNSLYGYVKYDNNGSLLHSVGIHTGENSSMTIESIEVDSDENVYLVGSYSGNLHWAPLFNFPSLSNSVDLNYNSLFILKYDASGNPVSSISLEGGSDSSNITCRDIAVSNSGEIYITGSFDGQFDMNPSAGVLNIETPLASSGESMFIAKYDATGNVVYANAIRGTDDQFQTGISLFIESNSNITLFGVSPETTDFDPAGASVTLGTNQNTQVGFKAVYDLFGNFVSVDQLFEGNAKPEKFQKDNNENIYVNGSFTSALSSGVNSIISNGSDDLFMMKFDNALNNQYIHQIGTTSFSENDIQSNLDEAGNLNIMASIKGNVDVDPSGNTNYLSTNTGGYDFLMARYNSDGELMYSYLLGDDEDQSLKTHSFSITNDGDVFVITDSDSDVDHDFSSGVFNNNYHFDGKHFTISKYQQSRLTATASVDQQVLCAGQSTGEATVVPDGSHPPFTYLWAPSGATTATATGLSAGSHLVTVTDALGSYVTETIVITEPITAISASIGSQTDATCFGGTNGSASISASGGTGTLSYAWSPSGGNASFASGLAADNYTVTITDANMCSIDLNVTITEPFPLTLSIVSQINVSCNGGNNGAVTVSASGGSGTNSFSWQPIGVSGTTVSNLTAGNYTAQVQDLNGCLAQINIPITEPQELVSTISNITNVTCAGTADGDATVLATGGVTPYNYFWLPQGGNNATSTSLAEGNYIVNIQDANGCTTSSNVEIQNIIPTQEVCLVTVDTVLADHNIVIWEKDAGAGDIDSFYVYREITTNNYQKIGAVDYAALSLFEDYTANPNTTSYKYRITALDTCGTEGEYGLFHKSIHLQYSGLGNFQWSFYEIESTANQVASYNFWRDDNGDGNWQILQTVSGSSSSFTDNDYALYPNAIYRVDLNWIGGYVCSPTSTSINTSRSNQKSNVAGSGSNIIESLSELVQAYPNPSAGEITLSVPQTMVGHAYILRDGLGKLIMTDVINTSNEFINLSTLEIGIYFIQIPTEFGLISKKFIKN